MHLKVTFQRIIHSKLHFQNYQLPKSLATTKLYANQSTYLYSIQHEPKVFKVSTLVLIALSRLLMVQLIHKKTVKCSNVMQMDLIKHKPFTTKINHHEHIKLKVMVLPQVHLKTKLLFERLTKQASTNRAKFKGQSCIFLFL